MFFNYFNILYSFDFFKEHSKLNKFLNKYVSGYSKYFHFYILDPQFLLLHFFLFYKVFLYFMLYDKCVIFLFTKESFIYYTIISHFNSNYLNFGLLNSLNLNNLFFKNNFFGFYTGFYKNFLLKNVYKNITLLLLFQKFLNKDSNFFLGTFFFQKYFNLDTFDFNFYFDIYNYLLAKYNNYLPDLFISFFEMNFISSYFFEWCSFNILNICFCNLNLYNKFFNLITYPVFIGDFSSIKIFFIVNLIFNIFSLGLVDRFYFYILKIENNSIYNFNSFDISFFFFKKKNKVEKKKKVILHFLILKNFLKLKKKNNQFFYTFYLYLYLLLLLSKIL